ncbi:acyltransferase family protein [Nocardioides campestrisoli]|uniref:acyltransferase family protein n=1 Tax=Nocardioides campestrisoli TaxID=2736757 RepID=UPI00163D71A1|nr:acyltransferase family protein [Nocardioides campestrisoli]
MSQPKTHRPVPPTWSYRPELDGMRAFGALVIIFFHAQVTGFSSSFIVLDMFFVLSGFVVTNVVLGEVDAKGRLRLGAYYARRVRRLLPAAVATIVLTCGLFLVLASQPERFELVRQAQSALVYLANWQFIADGADYFAGDIRESPFMHFWSLSVEEQYYIFFPLLVIAWYRWGRRRPELLLGVVVLLIAASVTAQVLLARVDPMRAYFGTDTRLFQLLAGVALAVALREYSRARDDAGRVSWPRAGRVLAWSGAAGFLVFGTELVPMTVSNRNLLATVLSLALIAGAYTAPSTPVARFLALPSMAYLGTISYGMYLWHWPIIVVLERMLEAPGLVVAVLTVPLTIGLASVSHRFLETPIRSGKRLDGFHWPVVGAGVAVSVVAAVVVVPPVMDSERTPMVAAAAQSAAASVVSERAQAGDELAQQLQRPVPRGLDFRAIGKDRGPAVTRCRPEDPEACLVVDGDGPHVVLVGDSHARMLTPAFTTLARERGFRLSANVVPACPWPHGLVSTKARGANRDRCLESRQGFYNRTLPQLDADLVVLVNAPRGTGVGESLVGYDGEPVKLPQAFGRAVQRTVELVEEAGARAVMVKGMMGTEGWGAGRSDPLDCLARARTQAECVVVPPQDRPLSDAYYKVAAGDRDSAATLDLNPVICPDHPTCRPIIDGQVVWRNADHVTATYLEQHRDDIWERLVETGFLGGRR